MTARTSSDTAREIPEATVARLPVYLRALTTLADEGTITCSSEELAVGRRREQRQAAQGPVLPRQLRHPRGRVRRRLPALPDRPRRSASPRTGRSSSSGSATWATRWPTTPGSAAAASGSSRCSTPTRPATHEIVAGVDVRPFSDMERSSREHGVAIGVIATPAAAAQDVADRMVAAGITQHPQLRADGAGGARGRRRPQGRPVHRAADPGLPRAAQGSPGSAALADRGCHRRCRSRRYERPGGGRLPQDRAGRAAGAAGARRRRRPQAARRRRRRASTSPRRP